MKPQSAKNKGRRLQQWVRQALISLLGLDPADIESRSMGAGGEDIMLSASARKKFPYSVECKNTESLNVWKAYQQAKANCGEYIPMLVIKKNREVPLVVVEAEHYFNKLVDNTIGDTL